MKNPEKIINIKSAHRRTQKYEVEMFKHDKEHSQLAKQKRKTQRMDKRTKNKTYKTSENDAIDNKTL